MDDAFDKAIEHVNATFPKRRATFNIEFSVDLDRIPGWGNNPKDWEALIEEVLTRNAHYNPEVNITLTNVKE